MRLKRGIFAYSSEERIEVNKKAAKIMWKGKKLRWWTNGETAKRAIISPGNGWELGRLKSTKIKISKTLKNNQTENNHAKD